MGRILLENMRFYAFHGVYAEEQRIGNDFVIDLQLDFPFGNSVQTDHLSDTVNYEAVYQLVKKQMMIPSMLLEHLAERILTQLMQSFPALQYVEIRLSKLHPPLGGEIERVTVVLEKHRASNP